MALAFLDANVVVYLAEDETKAGRAEDLLAEGGVVSVQVLNEFVSVASRKYRMPWPCREITAFHSMMRSSSRVLVLPSATRSSPKTCSMAA